MTIEEFVRLESRKCVNSNHIAVWLGKENEDLCQCIFKCKVKVSISKNGHPPYTYILTEKEYNETLKNFTQERPELEIEENLDIYVKPLIQSTIKLKARVVSEVK